MPRSNSMLEKSAIKTSRMNTNFKKFRESNWPPEESEAWINSHGETTKTDRLIKKKTEGKVADLVTDLKHLQNKLAERDECIKVLRATIKRLEKKNKKI